MKAKEGNIINNKRNKLEDVIPLDTPYTLAIDPCNLCNFKCKFCAMQTGEKQNYQKQYMKIEGFKKIIDDVSTFPHKLKILRINGQGEPLLAPDYIDMVKYASQKHIADYIETITNGSLLNPEFNTELVDSGLNRLRISIEAVDDAGYRDMAGVNIDFQKLCTNISDLYKKSRGKMEIYIKTVDAAVETPEKEKMFYETFGDICDQIFVDRVVPLWSDFSQLYENFAINMEGMHGQKLQNVKVCPFSFYSLLINPDGDVTLCCADWKRKYIVGNVFSDSLNSIWNGKKLRSFWKDMLLGEKDKYEMCRKCLLPIYDCNDNIDNYVERILEKII